MIATRLLVGLPSAVESIAVRLCSTALPLRDTKPKSQHDRPSHFVDWKRVKVIGGAGGDGCISFAHLFCNPNGGPDGGDGGNGGHVIFQGSPGHPGARRGEPGACRAGRFRSPVPGGTWRCRRQGKPPLPEQRQPSPTRLPTGGPGGAARLQPRDEAHGTCGTGGLSKCGQVNAAASHLQGAAQGGLLPLHHPAAARRHAQLRRLPPAGSGRPAGPGGGGAREPRPGPRVPAPRRALHLPPVCGGPGLPGPGRPARGAALRAGAVPAGLQPGSPPCCAGQQDGHPPSPGTSGAIEEVDRRTLPAATHLGQVRGQPLGRTQARALVLRRIPGAELATTRHRVNEVGSSSVGWTLLVPEHRPGHE
ncbi:conserved hypothetical protein [Ixodes scapularis]|uniref:Obg domain-containing protein n=1 Tax=Ixodes scapularis TaxID=6945 RepID=B7P2W8_IXOSC|nr:conserved hypothetical protein [Ixodes scapularis]|eukprot:XP_002403092.1 conserved hypothetical protein [Ixodes scapularis]